jgi:hypothetical protein
MVVVAVGEGWGVRFASSWPGPFEASCCLVCLSFCIRFSFVPERKTKGKTKPPDDENAEKLEKNTTCRRKENERRKSRSLTKM